jgi:hypothetical protein
MLPPLCFMQHDMGLHPGYLKRGLSSSHEAPQPKTSPNTTFSRSVVKAFSGIMRASDLRTFRSRILRVAQRSTARGLRRKFDPVLGMRHLLFFVRNRIDDRLRRRCRRKLGLNVRCAPQAQRRPDQVSRFTPTSRQSVSAGDRPSLTLPGRIASLAAHPSARQRKHH